MGELHASVEPKISELLREEKKRRELKHLSTGRKRKQIVMPLLAESEKGIGQSESPPEKEVEMWLDKDLSR